MAEPVFAIRGENLEARRSSSGKGSGIFSATAGDGPIVVNTHLAGMIGNFFINLYRGVVRARALIFTGKNNCSSNRATSILIRCAFNDDASLQGVWHLGGPWASITPSLMYLFYASGTLRIALSDEHGINIFANNSIATFTPVVGQFYDIVVTSTGDTTADGFKLYVDNVLLGQLTLPQNIQFPRDMNLVSHIALGAVASDVAGTSTYDEEFAIWDYIINTGAVQLESGIGALNGNLRTSFIAATPFDGLASTDPGIGNVREATSYMINGVAEVGTLHVPVSTDPGQTNVLEGVTYEINDVNKTGSLHIPVSTDPGVTHVQSGVTYEINDVNKVGTLHIPISSDPGVGNVLQGVTYEIDDVNKVGTRVFAPNSIADIGVYIVSGDTDGTPVNIFQGEDRTLRFLLKKSDGTPYSLVGVTELSVIMPANGDPLEKSLGDGVTIFDAAGGAVDLTIDRDDTADLLIQNLQSLEMIVDNSSNRRIFQSSGVFNVLKPIVEDVT